MDLRQNREYAKYMEMTGWKVVRLSREAGKGRVVGYVRKLPLLPLGMMKIQRCEGLPKASELRRVQRNYRVIYTIVEPLRELPKWWMGFKETKSSYLPSATREVELRAGRERLWRNLKPSPKLSQPFDMAQGGRYFWPT